MSLIHLDDVVHGKDAESLEHDVRQAPSARLQDRRRFRQPRQVQTAETSR